MAGWEGDRRRLPWTGLADPRIPRPLARRLRRRRAARRLLRGGRRRPRAHGTESDADTIRDTAVAQPLIVAAGLLALGAPARRRPRRPHRRHRRSLGRRDHRRRGRRRPRRGRRHALRRRARPGDGGCRRARAHRHERRHRRRRGRALIARLDELGLEPANFNGGGQIVVAGALDALEQLKAEPPAGARVIPLQVAGAFHTRYMRPAVERLRAPSPRRSTPSDPASPSGPTATAAS